MNREQYQQAEYNRIMGVPDGFSTPILVTRGQYLAGQLERINSEVVPCPGAQTTPDINPEKASFFGLRVQCTACGFTVEVPS